MLFLFTAGDTSRPTVCVLQFSPLTINLLSPFIMEALKHRYTMLKGIKLLTVSVKPLRADVHVLVKRIY